MSIVTITVVNEKATLYLVLNILIKTQAYDKNVHNSINGNHLLLQFRILTSTLKYRKMELQNHTQHYNLMPAPPSTSPPSTLLAMSTASVLADSIYDASKVVSSIHLLYSTESYTFFQSFA